MTGRGRGVVISKLLAAEKGEVIDAGLNVEHLQGTEGISSSAAIGTSFFEIWIY